MFKRICVFCGSSKGFKDDYRKAAEALGRLLVKEKIALVYGGGNVGLMGIIADAVMAAGGEAIGVIPEILMKKEVGHKGLTELRVVKSMHERKATMAELSDGFIAMPGGFGTYEELFEVVTWTQLGLHRKPVGLLNVAGFYSPLKALVDTGKSEGFIRSENSSLIVDAPSPEALLALMKNWQPPTTEKWLDRTTS